MFVPAEDPDLAEAVKVPEWLFVYILIGCLYPVSLLSWVVNPVPDHGPTTY